MQTKNKSLYAKDQKPGQHRIETRYLFMYHPRVRLQIERYLSIDQSQQRQHITTFPMNGQLLSERMNEPRPALIVRVAPR